MAAKSVIVLVQSSMWLCVNRWFVVFYLLPDFVVHLLCSLYHKIALTRNWTSHNVSTMCVHGVCRCVYVCVCSCVGEHVDVPYTFPLPPSSPASRFGWTVMTLAQAATGMEPLVCTGQLQSSNTSYHKQVHLLAVLQGRAVHC